jgi:uncharacterized membrane-anchored protein YhcB (DUF1043 family)
MFRTIWIIAAVILAVAWIIYGLWKIIDHFREKKRPKPTTKHLQQVKKSFEEYAKKMESYKKPTYQRDDEKK